MAAAREDAIKVFWDVDAAATLDEIRAAGPSHPIRQALHSLDFVLTYGGGDPVVTAYRTLGARQCVPVYNALDPELHFPVRAEPRFHSDLSLLANRLPDREQRIGQFFLEPAQACPDQRFLLGGSGWDTRNLPDNVKAIGHVPTRDHNAFNTSARAVLNVARDSMAAIGFSPATRVFEAAGAAACLITDAWEGIELFLQPGTEVLVARDGRDVADHLANLTPERARSIGEAARRRVLAEHTYERRGADVDALFRQYARLRRSAA
jgi:spore maturation protein CgeB